MALSDLVASFKAVNPFNARSLLKRASELLDGLVIAGRSEDVIEDSIVCVHVQADILTIAGEGEISRIEGGYARDTATFGTETADFGGIISNFVFRETAVVDGQSWEFNNCVFLNGITVNEGTVDLNGCKVLGTAERVAGTANATLTDFSAYPTGTWTLVFADTTP